jgi:cytochrome c oxidase subunit 1
MIHNRRLATANVGVAVGAFGIATFMALMQSLSRASLDLPGRSAKMYYLSVTAHGVLMAIVFTTFFIMGLGVAFTTRALDRPLKWPKLAWAGFWIAMIGTAMTAWAILWGKASVLYTFYPPLQAHWAFYVGATLLVVGSWVWGAVVIATYLGWKKDNPGKPVPLVVYGILSTIIVWYLATIGVAAEMLFLLIPWSLGLTETVDPLLARMLFSDPLARMVFALFIILSTPVGFHHQFMDPGISAGWKMAHTVSTFAILFPSFVTAFTVTASLEVAGRMRGATGLLDWIGKLPWGNPLVAAVLLSMMLFAIGGLGGAINAAFGMNAVVHNTAWIQGHFHLTVGSAVALTFMGVCYWLVPKLVDRDLELGLLAKWQPYLWFLGMMFFSISNHITGIMGMPRRVYEANYGGAEAAAQWEGLTLLSAGGGILLFVSAAFFLLVMLGTVTAGRKAQQPALEFAEPLEGEPRKLLVFDKIWAWVVVAVILVALAYAYPLADHLSMETFGSRGFQPF